MYTDPLTSPILTQFPTATPDASPRPPRPVYPDRNPSTIIKSQAAVCVCVCVLGLAAREREWVRLYGQNAHYGKVKNVHERTLYTVTATADSCD